MVDFHLRPKTLDDHIYSSVIEDNDYRLPKQFEISDIILDIGAHIGCFTYACLKRGAGRVLGFEPDSENFEHLRQNIDKLMVEYPGRKVELYPCGVWKSGEGISHSSLRISEKYPNFKSKLNTGGKSSIFVGDSGKEVIGVSLDFVLSQLGGRVRLLKLDCEGSEFPILLTSKRLDLVDEIVGEYHEISGRYPDLLGNVRDTIPDHCKISGYDKFTIEVLAKYLRDQGFTSISFERFEGVNQGLFFAKR